MQAKVPQILKLGSFLPELQIWNKVDTKDEEKFKNLIFTRKNKQIKKRKIKFKCLQTKDSKKFRLFETGKIYFRIKQFKYVQEEVAQEYSDSENIEQAKSILKRHLKKELENFQNKQFKRKNFIN